MHTPYSVVVYNTSMKNLFRELASLSKSLLLALVLSLGVSFAYAQFGPDPGTVAPANNVPAPVNVGTEAQVKAGPLGVTAFTADSIQMNGQTLRLSGGTEGASNVGYGAATVRGAKQGWGGLSFKSLDGSADYGTLMMHQNYSGFYLPGNAGWRWYVDNGGNSIQSGSVSAGSVSASTVTAPSYVYSPTYYGYPNIGYHLVPNGTSRLNAINADCIYTPSSQYCATGIPGGWNFYQSSPGGTAYYLYGVGVMKNGLFYGKVMCDGPSLGSSKYCGYAVPIDCSPGSYYAIYHGSQDYCTWLYSQYYYYQVEVRGLSVYAVSRIW